MKPDQGWLIVWLVPEASATGDAKLKFTEAAPTDGFAGEEVDQSGSLLTANAAACSCLFFFESWPQAHQLSR